MVTEEIAEKVTRASAELGYRPNVFAQSLKNQSIFYHWRDGPRPNQLRVRTDHQGY